MQYDVICHNGKVSILKAEAIKIDLPFQVFFMGHYINFVIFFVFCIFFANDSHALKYPLEDKLDISFITDFFPSKDPLNLENLPFKGSILIEENKKYQIYMQNIRKAPFSFKVYFQIQGQRVSDTLIVTPGQIVFSPFLKKFIDIYKGPFQYFIVEKTAFHLLEEKNFFVLLSSTCTITCFPTYIAQVMKDRDPKLPTLLEKLFQTKPEKLFFSLNEQ
jgi:hypothetical protein